VQRRLRDLRPRGLTHKPWSSRAFRGPSSCNLISMSRTKAHLPTERNRAGAAEKLRRIPGPKVPPRPAGAWASTGGSGQSRGLHSAVERDV
jgi:hypothetical protein